MLTIVLPLAHATGDFGMCRSYKGLKLGQLPSAFQLTQYGPDASVLSIRTHAELSEIPARL